MARLSVSTVLKVASWAGVVLAVVHEGAPTQTCEDADVRAWECRIPAADPNQRLMTKQEWYSDSSGRAFAVSSQEDYGVPMAPFATRVFVVATETGAVVDADSGGDLRMPPFHLFDPVASHVMDDVVHLSTVQNRQLGLRVYPLGPDSRPANMSVFKYATPCAADEALCRFLVIGSARVPGSATSEQRMVLLHQKTNTKKLPPSNWTNVELVGVKWEPANGYKQLWHLTIKTDGSTPNPHNAVFSPDAEVVNFYHNFGDFHGIVSTYDFSTGKALHAGSMYPFASVHGVKPLVVFPPPAGAPNQRDLYGIAESFDLSNTYYIVQRNSTYGIHGVQEPSRAITRTYASHGFKEDGSRLLTFVRNILCNSTTPGGLLSGGEGRYCLRVRDGIGLDIDVGASAFHPSMTTAWAFNLGGKMLTIADNQVSTRSQLLHAPLPQSAFYAPATDTVVFAVQRSHTLMGYKGTCKIGGGSSHNPAGGSGSHNPSGGGLGGVAIALIIVGVLFVIGLGVGWACRRPSPSSYADLPPRRDSEPKHAQSGPPPAKGFEPPLSQQPQGVSGPGYDAESGHSGYTSLADAHDASKA